MDIPLINNLNSNPSCLQNNQQQARNIDTVIKNGRVFYLCPVTECPKMFTRKDSLNDHHLSAHDNKRTRSCDTCGERFNTKRQLNQHEKTHGDKKFICYICDRSFICPKYLSAHNNSKLHNRNINNILIGHSPYKPNPYITEDKSRSVGIVTKVHSKLNHENQNVYQDNNKPDPLKLPDNKMVCAEQDINDDTMLYITQVTQKTNFLSYIEEQFNENILFDAKQNPDKKDIEPLTAGFSIGISLTTNLTPNASCLQNNQQQATNIDKVKKNSKRKSKKYPCTFEGCTRILSRKDTLDDHMLTHYNEQKYPCDNCNKGFNTPTSLKIHKKTHGDKKFTCYLCDKHFTHKAYLNSHNSTKLHIRKENNTATYSGLFWASSAKLAKLTKHSQQYTVKTNNSNTRKKIPCPFKNCNQLFATVHTLKDHKLLHKNKQNYPCNKCNSTFNTKKILKQHEQIHETGKFLCNTCNIAFKRKEHLQNHNKTQLHNRNINNIPINHNPYKPDPCITDAKNYSVEVAIKEQPRLNHENQNIYQDNNKYDSLKVLDNTMICAEVVIQGEDFNENNLLNIEISSNEDTEDYSSDTEKDFNENNLLDIEISSDEDIESLTAGLNYDDIVAHYL